MVFSYEIYIPAALVILSLILGCKVQFEPKTHSFGGVKEAISSLSQ